MEITKQHFEQALPVGISKSDAIWEKVRPQIDAEYQQAVTHVLGEAGLEMLETDTQWYDYLRQCFAKYVCLKAFLAVLRQLDLVLTGSGFGVVSSDKYAPASKMRVDALEGQLRTEVLKAHGWLVDALRSQNWGQQLTAEIAIPSIYPVHVYFATRSDGSVGYQDWEKFKKSVDEAECLLRVTIGDEMVDKVLSWYRCSKTTEYSLLHGRMMRLCQVMADNGLQIAQSTALPEVVKVLERNLDKYPEWRDSGEYEAWHGKRYENTKDSGAFFFG